MASGAAEINKAENGWGTFIVFFPFSSAAKAGNGVPYCRGEYLESQRFSSRMLKNYYGKVLPEGERRRLNGGGLLGLLFLLERDKPYGMSNILELFPADVIKAFAFAGELFVDLNSLFGHLLVGFLGASDELEILTGGNPLMTIRV